MLALALTGAFFIVCRKKQNNIGDVWGIGWLIVSSVYLFSIIWLALHAGLGSYDAATGISLMIYTLAGLSVYIAAGMHDIKWLRIYGDIILGVVVARLMLVDVWDMELAGRIITFFLIGLLLVLSAFVARGRFGNGKDNT
jgi:hypothetical protein